ncbi:hypothetical protein DOY81_011665 [Sarcophaga bullata]|nr:hypothetical protein DOY81_011665 [Sarcophaga bullata]
MKRSTFLMIDVVFIYALLLGGLNFSFDRRSGIARVKPYILIYSAVMNLIMVAIIIYFTVTIDFKTRPPGRDELSYKFTMLLLLIRATAIITTLLCNWINLSDFVKFINAYRNFSLHFIRKWRAHEKYEKHMEQGIRLRCICTVLVDILMYLGAIIDLQDIFDINNNLMLLFYYFAILNTNVLLIIINDELKRILATAFILHQNHSRATLARHGQTLAKELDELAESQLKLNAFIKRINKIFDLQGACVMLDFYVNNIYVIYLSCLLYNDDAFLNGFEDGLAYILFTFYAIYYTDLKVFMFNILRLGDLMKKTVEILKERYYLGQQMEKSLEKSFTNYSLQLAINPLEIEVVGLYKLNRAMAFASFSSTISNAIVLIQYDFEYSE